MAYKLIWSPASRDDLHDIVSFISRDSSQRAEAFAYRLIAETDKLQKLSGDWPGGAGIWHSSYPRASSSDLTVLSTASIAN